jgi:Amt family ammonium transporter
METLSPDGVALRDGLVVNMTLPLAEQTTVLVIDDNADVLQLFRRYLSGTRFRFLGTQDAEKGLHLAQECAPGVVVLDVMMPGRDGWAMLSHLREHPLTQNIPVVVCTILAQPELAHVLGAAHFIRKPVSRPEFLGVLHTLTDSQPRESD